jgi:hypothetical protein
MNGRSTASLERKPSMLEARRSTTLLPCEKWVSLRKEYLQSVSVLKWKNHSLYEKYPLQMNRRNTCILWKKNSMLEAGESCTLFPYENWVTFWRENSLHFRVFKCKEHHFCANEPIQVKGRSTVSLASKPPIWEAGEFSTLFPCKNSVSLSTEYLGFESVLKWENDKCPLPMKWRNTRILWNNTICVKGKSVLHIISLWELSNLLIGILPTSHSFQVWGMSPFCKKLNSSEWRNKCFSCKKTINVWIKRV